MKKRIILLSFEEAVFVMMEPVPNHNITSDDLSKALFYFDLPRGTVLNFASMLENSIDEDGKIPIGKRRYKKEHLGKLEGICQKIADTLTEAEETDGKEGGRVAWNPLKGEESFKRLNDLIYRNHYGLLIKHSESWKNCTPRRAEILLENGETNLQSIAPIRKRLPFRSK